MSAITEATRPSRTGVAERVHLLAMLALTFSTGIADAVGYLALDRVFTGNMTGNVVILGMGAAGTVGLPVAGPLIALTAFMGGAACGGRAMREQGAAWTGRTTLLLTLVGIAFGAAAGGLGLSDVSEGSATAFVLTAVLAGAMGLQAAVARRIAVKDVTTVVITSTITSLAADSRLGARLDQSWVRRAAAITLIGCGACAGALLLTVQIWMSVAVPAVLTVATAVIAGRLLRDQQAG